MSILKPSWKLTFVRSSTPSSSSTTTEMRVEFLCPISRSLMADPVIVSTDPTGQTFERACVQACIQLAFTPSHINLDLAVAQQHPPLLIPNVALKGAILDWCQRSGFPPPLPLPLEAARSLVRSLMPAPATDNDGILRGPVYGNGAAFSKDRILGASASGDGDGDGHWREDEISRGPASAEGGYRAKNEILRAPASFYRGGDDDDKGDSLRLKSRSSDENLRPPMSPSNPMPTSLRTKKSVSPSATISSNSSSHSSTEIPSQESPKFSPVPSPNSSLPLPPGASGGVDPLEDQVLTKLRDPSIAEQESASSSLRQATREGRERRLALCTPRLLAALRPMLLSRSPAVQSNAAAAVVNLSLEPANKIRIVRSGAVPPLIDVLRSGASDEAQDHAAAALFSLALDDDNRAAIGVLGAIPPLLALFTSPDAGRARRDAGMALYHLSLAGANRSKIAHAPGAVRGLLATAGERDDDAGAAAQGGPGPARLAMMIVCNLAGSPEGRAALMDGGAVAAVVGMMAAAGAAAEEQCVAALYGMSRGSLRFRGLARAAGAERVLARVVEESGGAGEVRREMAKKTLRAMRGEDDDDYGASSMAFPAVGGGDGGSVVSAGMISLRPRNRQFGGGSGMNSAEF